MPEASFYQNSLPQPNQISHKNLEKKQYITVLSQDIMAIPPRMIFLKPKFFTPFSGERCCTKNKPGYLPYELKLDEFNGIRIHAQLRRAEQICDWLFQGIDLCNTDVFDPRNQSIQIDSRGRSV